MAYGNDLKGIHNIPIFYLYIYTHIHLCNKTITEPNLRITIYQKP